MDTPEVPSTQPSNVKDGSDVSFDNQTELVTPKGRDTQPVDGTPTNEQGGSGVRSSDEDYDGDVAIDESVFDTETNSDDSNDYEEKVNNPGKDFEQEDGDENVFETEGSLEEEAIIEEEEEIEDQDINIDSGFLNDNKGNTVDLPAIETRASATAPSTGFTFIFFFCAFGGMNENGPVTAVDVLSNGISNPLQALSFAAMPNEVTKGGESSAAYTHQSITTCSNGYSILSPYGYLYKPGSCYEYNLYSNSNAWKETGAKLTTYRKGGTMTKLGRYLMAMGGNSGKRSLRTIELFDPKKPEKGWRKAEKLTMPASVSEHCTVTLKGRNGKEVIVIGGKGRENRALKLDVNSNK